MAKKRRVNKGKKASYRKHLREAEQKQFQQNVREFGKASEPEFQRLNKRNEKVNLLSATAAESLGRKKLHTLKYVIEQQKKLKEMSKIENPTEGQIKTMENIYNRLGDETLHKYSVQLEKLKSKDWGEHQSAIQTLFNGNEFISPEELRKRLTNARKAIPEGDITAFIDNNLLTPIEGEVKPYNISDLELLDLIQEWAGSQSYKEGSTAKGVAYHGWDWTPSTAEDFRAFIIRSARDVSHGVNVNSDTGQEYGQGIRRAGAYLQENYQEKQVDALDFLKQIKAYSFKNEGIEGAIRSSKAARAKSKRNKPHKSE